MQICVLGVVHMNVNSPQDFFLCLKLAGSLLGQILYLQHNPVVRARVHGWPPRIPSSYCLELSESG